MMLSFILFLASERRPAGCRNPACRDHRSHGRGDRSDACRGTAPRNGQCRAEREQLHLPVPPDARIAHHPHAGAQDRGRPAH